MHKLVCAVAVMLGAASCGPAPATPEPEDYDDIANGVAPLLVSDKGGNAEELGAAAEYIKNGSPPQGWSETAAGEVTASIAGFSYSASITCQVASGAAVPCDGSTLITGAALTTAGTGSITLPAYQATATSSGTYSARLVNPTTMVFTGRASFEADSRYSGFGNAQSEFTFVFSAEYRDVTVDLVTLLPRSGSLALNIEADRSASTARGSRSALSFRVKATLTYDGSTARLVLDNAFAYDLNLATGAVVKVSLP